MPNKRRSIPSDKLVELASQRKETDLPLVLRLNAAMLDALYRLSLVELSDDEFDFLDSQMRKTPVKVIEYLQIMWVKRYARKPKV